MLRKRTIAILMGAALLLGAGFAVGAADAVDQTSSATAQEEPALLKTILIQEHTELLDVSVSIPQLTEAAVSNQTSREAINKVILDDAQEHLAAVRGMREEAADHLRQYSAYQHYSVVAKGDILSILVSQEDYTGGAHGMNYVIGYNINLKTGKLLSLSDLFVTGSFNMAVKTINTRIALEIASNPEGGYYENPQIGAFSSIAPDQNFYFSGSGLVIQFQPYDIAPYAAGAVGFKIPYADLEPAYTEQIQAFLKGNQEIGTADVMVNGKPVSAAQRPYLKGGVWMVPLRLTAELLDYTVDWDAEKGQATVAGGVVRPGLDSYGNGVSLGMSPEILEDSMYVPAEYFTRVLEKNVEVYYGRLYIYE